MTDVTASSARDSFAAIAIEGIGTEGAVPNNTDNNDKGWLITTSGAARHADEIDQQIGWTVKPWLVFDDLSMSGVDVEIFQAGAYWSKVKGTIEAKDEAAQRLVWTQFRGQAVLEERLTSSATTIKLSRDDLADNVIYIGDETIELGSKTGTSGGVSTYDIEHRGQYRSRQLGHEKEANVFTRAPYLDARRIQFYTGEILPNDPGSTADPGIRLTQRGLGQLVGNVTQDRGKLSFNTRGGGARLKEMEAGKKDRRIENAQFALVRLRLLRGVRGNAAEYETKILKPEAGETSSGKDSAVQLGDRVVPANLFIDTSTTPNSSDGLTVPAKTTALWGKATDTDSFETPDDQDGQPVTVITDEPFEVFAVQKSRDVTPLHIVGDTLGEKYRYHPLTYYAAFHLSTRQTSADASTFDVLQPDWSLNAKWLFSDTIVADIKGLIRERPNETIKRMALGKDNDTAQLRDFCVNVLLHGYGYYESTNIDGTLSIERVKTPTISDHDDALGRPVSPLPSATLNLDPARDRTKSSLQATLGDTDFTEGRSIFVENDVNTDIRPNDFTDGAEIEYDLSTADPQSYDGLVDQLADRLQLQSFPQNRLTFLAPDQVDKAASYDLGEFVNLDGIDLSPEWIIDNSGNRVSNLSEIEATGIIVGRQLHLTDQAQSKAYTLTVIFVGDQLTRWRAPSGKIQSTSLSGTDRVLTVEGDSGDATHFGQTKDDGTVQPDAGLFTAGDEVEIYASDGTYWVNSAVKSVKSVDAGARTITIDGDWSDAPPTGYYVELAHIDSDGSGVGYVNNGLAGTFDNIDRAYVYLADTSDTIGDAGVAADQYGV